MWVAMGEDHGYRLILCANSRATHVFMDSIFFWTTLPRHVLGILVMEESDGVHSQGCPRLHIFQVSATKRVLVAQHIIGNSL